MKRALVVVLPLLIAAACSESKEHPAAPPQCADGMNCAVGPGGTGSGATKDSGALDGASDAEFEVGDGGVAVTATVRPLSKFVTDPYTVATFDTVSISLRAPRVGGGEVEATMPFADGSYALNGVAPAIGSNTFLEVWKAGTRRTLAGVNAVAPPMAGFSLPLFADLLPRTTWETIVATTAYPTGSATVVVHLYRRDTAGTFSRKPGVRATPFGSARGPYYDDGTDISATATATGASATIVFLGITGTGTFGLNLTDTTIAKSYETVLLPVAADAVTHLALDLTE